MRLIPTRIHGVMDYLMGAIVAASPWLLGFARGGPETWVPLLLGGGMIAYSALTDYELGLLHIIPMPAHLMIDAAGGLLLLASPWLFGFAHIVWVPHVVFGLLEIGAAATTQTSPSHRGSLGTGVGAA